MAILDVLTIITQVAGGRPPRNRLPARLVGIIAGQGRAIGVPAISHLRASADWQGLNTHRAREELGAPKPIPFEQTCRDVLIWFFEGGYSKGNPTARQEQKAR